MSQVLFIVGPPGVGKTTLVRGLLDPDPYFVQKPKWTVSENVCAAGHYTGGTFDGADTVPYNGVQACLDYWIEKELFKKRLTIFDGDRFSYVKVVDWFRAQEWDQVDVRCLFISAPEDVLEERRRARGSNQHAGWMKGRLTKALRFFDLFTEAERMEISNTRTPTDLLTAVRRII